MKYLFATAALAAAAGPAWADDIALKPLADVRIRNESVSQDGIARDADALTIRARTGVEASAGHWAALAEAQGTLGVVNRYYDGLDGVQTRPLVADPQNIALYRAQLQYRSQPFTLTVGRQRIALDDERFVGPVGFRDNGQTFDAVRAEIVPAKGWKADVSYVWSVRSIWGLDGRGARQQAVSGDTLLSNLSYVTPLGRLTGFAYLVDQDEAAVSGYRLSSQTYGGRFAGTHPLSKAVRLGYQFSYARQSDYHRNPNAYRADYYLADLSLEVRRLKLGAGYEVLGAAHGRAAGTALTSFQTPLATLFKFQGWADKFLTTPPDGVRDLYGSAGYGTGRLGRIDALTFQATYHDFRSDRMDRRYGTEWDLLASARIGRTTLSARYADYSARTFATDTHKFWVQADWAL